MATSILLPPSGSNATAHETEVSEDISPLRTASGDTRAQALQRQPGQPAKMGTRPATASWTRDTQATALDTVCIQARPALTGVRGLTTFLS